MANPAPGKIITTVYGKRGSHWSCNKNSAGQGVHTGVDYAAPLGFPLVAAIAGQIRHRNYGSAFGQHQFAISPDADQPFGADEVFYAHTRTRLPDGTRVNIGDFVAEVGAEGNVTGPHLHFEYHKGKNAWNCNVHRDPTPVIEHSAAVAVTKNIYSNKLGYGEPTNGDTGSDTVMELQDRLNDTPLPAPGNITLLVDGVYGPETDEVVRAWQKSIGNTPDPAGKSYLGPAQRALMFPSPPYTIHDNGLPAIASEGTVTPPVPIETPSVLGRWLKEQGFVVHDDAPLGRESTWLGVQFLMVHHTGSPDTNTPASDARWIRSGNADAPLAQLMLDRAGEVWICCRERDGQPDPGRASHAGNGRGYGVPDDKMNEVSLGIECQNNGKVPLSTNPVMYDTLIRLLDVLSKRYEVPVENIIGHKEWSSTGKIDPLDDMNVIRAALTETPPPDIEEIAPGNVYVSKLVLGQQDSDSVKRLQQTLNGIVMKARLHLILDVHGNYDDATDTVVQAWQRFSGFPPTTFVTVEQANLLFAGTGNTVIDDTIVVPPEPTEVVVNGGSGHDIQAGMNQAQATGKPLRLTGTFAVYANVLIPDGIRIDATAAKFFVNSETAAEGAKFKSGRFRNATNGGAPEYGQAGGWEWTGGEFDGNGEGIFTISHSPGFTIQGTVMYRYCSTGNTGHAIEINSSGGVDNRTGPYTVKILNNTFLGTDRGQRSNSNDEPVHFDWNWKGSGGSAPVWNVGNPVSEATQVMCHNVLVEGNTFHRRSESGGWQFAKCAIGGHDTSDTAFDPKYRHNHFMIRNNEIHGAVGATNVSPNKGAIHLCWLRDAKVEGNRLFGGVSKRYITAEDPKDATYCTATGNTSSNPALSNPNRIVLEG